MAAERRATTGFGRGASTAVPPAVRAFDRLAPHYDALVSADPFPLMRRAAHVWFAEVFGPGSRVLEVGCGSGHDTVFLAACGADVVAADPSAEMLARARTRLDAGGLAGRARFICCGVDALADHLPASLRVDGVVSNFGALNCVASLEPFARLVRARLAGGGRVIVGVMPPTCLPELFWFGMRGDLRRALRRRGPTPVAVTVAGILVPTSYHSVRDLARALGPAFRLRRVRALGCILPPPDVAVAWRRAPASLRRALAWVDARLAGLPPFNRVGDHVLAEFVRCP